MRIVMVIPTYNEKDNIGLLIDRLREVFQRISHEMSILVVDDNSPDGTASVVKEKMGACRNVFLITGKKEGLGSAYIRGMKHAMEEMNADAVMEMDADFSHNPEDVPRLVAALSGGADFVIGSRYVDGGSIPKGWGFMRKLISRGGNIFARYIAGMYRIRDCTAGFRAIRVSLLEKIDLAGLRIQGYAFQIVLLSQAVARNAVIREIPVEFVDRTRGESKIGVSDILEFMVNAWWIRLQNSKVFIRFCIVGLAGVFVNLGAFSLLIHYGMNKYIASPIAIEISIITNFLLNNAWTFSERNVEARFHVKGLKFNLVSFIALGVSYLVFVLLSVLFPKVAPQYHQAIGIVPATFVNYFFNTYWTFRHTPVK
ncbi:MAG: Dolichyl-phosphate beta-D-mannosyltransferase [Deltaproteobacteria bacterium]|nr:Dolichyl-phosphate beta-D-mannosyltransferase [Deltaproteobacteria bacterium]